MEKNVKLREDSERARLDSNRRAEERANQLRRNMNMLPVSRFHIPEEWIPEGWVYKWVRIGTRDVADFANETAAMEKGYTPVPSDRHPQLMQSYRTDPHTNPHTIAGCVVRDQMLLCEIPKCIDDEVKRRMAKEEHERTHNMNALKTGLDLEPLLPGHIFSNNVSNSMIVGSYNNFGS